MPYVTTSGASSRRADDAVPAAEPGQQVNQKLNRLLNPADAFAPLPDQALIPSQVVRHCAEVGFRPRVGLL